MPPRLLLKALTVALCCAPAALLGQRPDFSGEWTQVLDSGGVRPSVAATGDAAFRRGDMGSGWGNPLTIRQTPDLLIVEYQPFSTYDLQPKLRFVYTLNGNETRNVVMIGHANTDERARVSWNDGSLTIATTLPAPSWRTRSVIARVKDSAFGSAGEILNRNWPRLSVPTARLILSTATYTLASGAPVRESSTRPRTSPQMTGCWANQSGAAVAVVTVEMCAAGLTAQPAENAITTAMVPRILKRIDGLGAT